MLLKTLSLCAGFAAYAHASCLHATSQLRRRLTPRGTVEVSKFGYTNLEGPLNWASLSPENNLCNTGAVQSPINLDSTIHATSEKPAIVIDNVKSAELENLGTTVEVIVNGTTTLGGSQFNLKQFHVHTPSEHRINEEYFPLEMHMVHEAADGSGSIAVMAVLFEMSADGSTTDLLTSVAKSLAEIASPGRITSTGPLDFAPLITHLQTTPLLRYTGSLTTPPCAEGLTFLVTQQPMPLDVKTFNTIKGVVKFNSRYTQNALGKGNLLALSAAASAPAEAVASEAPFGNSTSAGSPTATEVAPTEVAQVAPSKVATKTGRAKGAATGCRGRGRGRADD